MWQAQKFSRDIQRKRYQGKQLGLEEEKFWWCGFSRWSNQKRHSGGRQLNVEGSSGKRCFAENGVLRELFALPRSDTVQIAFGVITIPCWETVWNDICWSISDKGSLGKDDCVSVLNMSRNCKTGFSAILSVTALFCQPYTDSRTTFRVTHTGCLTIIHINIHWLN